MSTKSVLPTTPLPSGTTPYRHAFSPRFRVVTLIIGPSLTVQSFRDECDVNTIMARYQQTGMLPPPRVEPRYADVTGYDFQEAQNLIAHSKSLFNQLPSSVRAEFDNDPAQFLDFASDPANKEQMREMGLLRPDAELPPNPATPVAPPPTGAPPSPLVSDPSGLLKPTSPSSTPTPAA